VLGALEETENAMTAFGRQRARRDYLREASAASQQAAKLARERYQNGVADFLTVLDAERVMLEAESRQAESETLTAVALVDIYRALGGGWETNGRVSAK
jgi:multidrug efflux system outer membrane protein